ncbi:hypothetical protein [Streptomyces seoulensis]|nr:hypothetical protein [Streptomyces seoulensis]
MADKSGLPQEPPPMSPQANYVYDEASAHHWAEVTRDAPDA